MASAAVPLPRDTAKDNYMIPRKSPLHKDNEIWSGGIQNVPSHQHVSVNTFRYFTPDTADSGIERASIAWREQLKLEKEPGYNDVPRPIAEVCELTPTPMQTAYMPKYMPHKLPEMVSQPDNYPAHRSPDQESEYNNARFDPHKFALCRFHPQVGMVVNVKESAMPCVITQKKTVKLEPGLECRGEVQSVKHLKLKPLTRWDELDTEETPDELLKSDWIMSTNCAPLDLYFSYYWHVFQNDKTMRPVYIDALKRQKALYPEATLVQLFHKFTSATAAVPKELLEEAAAVDVA